jgi:hypothetical protein
MAWHPPFWDLPAISDLFDQRFDSSHTYLMGESHKLYYRYKTNFTLRSTANEMLQQQSVLCQFDLNNPRDSGVNFIVSDLKLSFYDKQETPKIWMSGNSRFYIYAPVIWMNRGWNAEFTLEFYSSEIVYERMEVDISDAVIYLDRETIKSSKCDRRRT